ncbi:DNA cytosine methyltransferase [Paraburkholderia fungorum]|uniref:DNA cytosine methyltransferase n=1 Tax=Paraburkholderia fungorum TaxID=134537 RepID=UPI0038BC42DF
MKNSRKKIEQATAAPTNSQPILINSFFAGIGGFDLGFQKAGCEPAFHCEINEFCQKILKRHWPTVQTASDIREVKSADLPKAQVWCGGFPCQDVSVARGAMGRQGLKGKNTGLFYPFIQLIGESLPPVVLMENVTGLLSSHSGKDFLTVISSLTRLGYGVAWRVFNTRYFGAPQSRPRVYICAWREDVAKALSSLYEPGATHKPGNPRKGFLTSHRCNSSGAVVPEVSYCLAATSGRHTGTDWSRTYISYAKQVRRLTPVECEGLQGFPRGWTLPSKSATDSDEIDTLRYHALGNAVSTPVVEWVARRIANTLGNNAATPQATDLFEREVQPSPGQGYEDFKGKLARTQRISALDAASASEGFDVKWKTGGYAIGDAIFDAAVSPAPNEPIVSRLIDVIEKGAVAEHYFLSANAATGILRRVDGQGRELFGPLRDALAALASSIARSSEHRSGSLRGTSDRLAEVV